jgi:hypothetical protein
MITHTQSKKFIKRSFSLFILFGFLASMGCAQKGLVAEKYPSEFYRMPKLLPDEPMNENPKFIFYGDSKPGSRDTQGFLKKENWFTWKMLLFPFYEVYWLGNGFVGVINRLRHMPNYGLQERLMVRDAVYAEAKNSKVDFIINGGDMCHDGRRPSHWEKFLRENKIERPLVADFPFLPVIGNHEKATDQIYGLPNYEAIFAYPQFYVLDFPDVALFVVDSNLILDQYKWIDNDEQEALFEKWFVSRQDSEQPAWLERELASRNQPFKMVVIHHPPISFGKHHSDWTKSSWAKSPQKKRQRLLKLFYEQEVQVVLCCHEHLYEHSILRYSPDEQATEREIHFIVSGGGGVPLRYSSDAHKLEKYVQNYRVEGLDVSLVNRGEIYHYCLVDVDPDKITIQVLEVTKDATQPIRLAEEILISKVH